MNDAHARTRQYTGGHTAETPIGISCGDAVATPGGQIAILAAANATVRNHPIVYVVADDHELLTAASGTVHAALEHIGHATNSSRIEFVEQIPAGVVTIGVGTGVHADVFIRADRFTGGIDAAPSPIGADRSTIIGAGLAAMFAANFVFRRAIGYPIDPQRCASLWTLEDQLHSTGPADLPVVDVGTVWMIGAGGVAASAAWWIQQIGHAGPWTIIDHDRVEITNLNRCLGFFYPDTGLEHGDPNFKADLASRLIGAVPFNGTWNEWVATDRPSPDVLIPAANDFGVRADVASYSHPIALTGTTSPNWTAELHRYRAGHDGCTNCRHPVGDAPTLACSTVEVPTDRGERNDAALSFLSGTAGLLTAAGLVLLQHNNFASPRNHWQVAFESSVRRIVTPSRHQCEAACARTLTPPVRTRVHGDTRWFDVSHGD